MDFARLSGVLQDLRHAARALRHAPGFALGVISTLALGIGANATMFGVVDQLLFRPPALLHAPDRVSRVYTARQFRGKETWSSEFGYKRYQDLRQRTTSFDRMTPFDWTERPVGEGEGTRLVNVASSDADLWSMFDARPVIGRFFSESEATPPGGARVAVLSYEFWRSQYGGKRNVLGISVKIGSFSYSIIGVAPAGFSGFATDPIAAFVPMAAVQASNPNWHQTYDATWFTLFARRKAGVSQQRANADLSQAFVTSYRSEMATHTLAPVDVAKPRAIAGHVLSDRGPNRGDAAKVATWLLGVALIVLGIACANVANLLVARGLRRRREIAVRLALGVSRGRLLAQLLTEAMLLAALGGLAGVTLAQWGGAAIRALLLADMAPPSVLADGRLLLYAGALTILSGIMAGVGPALQASRPDVAASLKAGAREGVVHRSPVRLTLLVAQAALSVVLLVGAGLFVRSLDRVQHLRLGFDADRLLWVSLGMRGVSVDSAQRATLRDRIRERAPLIPGVENAARALAVPFRSNWQFRLRVDGIDSVSKLGDFTYQAASPELFATMGTRILRGRPLSDGDRAGAPRVMVVTKAMADRLWPGQDAIGKCVFISSDSTCTTVVGIAEDVRRRSFGAPENHYYVPIAQTRPTEGGIFVRTRGPAAAMAETVRRGLQELMPGPAFVTVTPMSSIVAPQMRTWKLGATMFTVFGALALVLAVVGLYSVIAYGVTQRMHEMGVRIAIGAQSRDVIALIVREGMSVVLCGIAIGTIAALLAGRWIQPLLFDVQPRDPTVFGLVTSTLAVASLAAMLIPAMRAARVDPVEALRTG